MSRLNVWSHTDANCVSMQLDTVWRFHLAGYMWVYAFGFPVHDHLCFSVLSSWKRQAASVDQRQETATWQNSAPASPLPVRLTPTPKTACPATGEEDTATMDSVLHGSNTAKDFGDQVKHQQVTYNLYVLWFWWFGASYIDSHPVCYDSFSC